MSLLLLAWIVTDCIATIGVWHFWRSIVPPESDSKAPPVVIVVAIKGTSANTAQFLESLFTQDYPRYRIVFALESASDPAWSLVSSARDRLAGLRAMDIVIAGRTSGRAQKVHNQREALSSLRDEDQIVAFADADTFLPPAWLSNLVRPIVRGEVEASTGYRWPLPQDGALATWVGAAADLSVTTSARSRHWNICWGGSCAVGRAALDSIDLRAVWEHASTDDVTLTRALRRQGYTINSPLRSLVPSPVSHTWRGLFAFARRQHMLMRTYAPRHWLVGGFALCVPAAGASASVAGVIAGNGTAGLCLLASILLLQVRVGLRRRIAVAILPASHAPKALSTLRFASLAWPLVHGVHCGAFLSSCVGRHVTWAGFRYRLGRRRTHVEVR